MLLAFCSGFYLGASLISCCAIVAGAYGDSPERYSWKYLLSVCCVVAPFWFILVPWAVVYAVYEKRRLKKIIDSIHQSKDI